MDRRFLALIIIIIIIIIAGVYLYSQYAYQNVGTNNTTGINTSANNSTVNNTVATVINIQNGTYTPNNVTIKSGTNVQWRNMDNVTHQVVSDTGQFQSSILNPGEVWNFYFAKSGVFGYHDSLHPTETGTITVT